MDHELRNGYVAIDVMGNNSLAAKLLLDIDVASFETISGSGDFKVEFVDLVVDNKMYKKFSDSIAAVFSRNQELRDEKRRILT